jgi:hypothetical protein
MKRRRRFFLREETRERLRLARLRLREIVPPKKLSEEIAILRDRFAAGPLTLGDVVGSLQGRAWTLVLILLALPFVTPIPLPLLSTPFGVAIALISLRLALGQRPWLPGRLLGKPLPAGFFDKVLRISARVLRLLEKLLRPRLAWIAAAPALVRVHALAMFLAACVLLLPLPVPFTNAFPAWLILLIAGGLMERDGGAILVGYAAGAGGVAYFYFLGDAAVRLLDAFRGWLAG